jgi:hypothetical protein
MELGASREWQCPACDSITRLPAVPPDRGLTACALCANAELYRKKDFPHWLGMLLLVIACLAFLVTNYLYQQWLAWAILLGSALLDGVLYLAVGDVVVCYGCGAHHRGFAAKPAHGPFELSIGERYRQAQLRRAQLRTHPPPPF